MVISKRNDVFERFGWQRLGETPWQYTIVARLGCRGGYALDHNWLSTCDVDQVNSTPNVNTASLRRLKRIATTTPTHMGRANSSDVNR